MLKNFFKVTFRNLWRSKSFSAINIIGLSIGMASALLIGVWITNELSVDTSYSNKDRLYLMYSRETDNGQLDAWAMTPSPLVAELKKDYPEVEDASKKRTVYFLMTVGEKHLNQEGIFVDSGFLSMFHFPLLQGNEQTALTGKQGIVLTQKLAKSLFGDEDPLGKTVRIDSSDNFTVTAILKDLPTNTEFTFQYLLPWSYLERLGWDKVGGTWQNTQCSAYVLLRPGASESAFDAKIQHIVRRHITEGEGSARETFSQPITRTHLYSRAENGQLVDGQIRTVRLFIIIAVFILLIACINFMNLSTARSERRAKEVGIRKVVGARKGSLIAQFIGESILFAFIAFILAIGLVHLSLKAFDQVIGIPLTIDYSNPYFWLFSFAFILFTGIVAGSYPAFFLSSARPVKVLKGGFKKVNTLSFVGAASPRSELRKGFVPRLFSFVSFGILGYARNLRCSVTPRKVLVVLQFTFAIILITCTIIVERQIQYACNRDAGYNRDRLAYTFVQGEVLPHYDAIKHELLSSGAAVGVTKTYSPMTRVWGEVTGYSWPGSTVADKQLFFTQFEADADFVRTTGTRLLEGRDIDLKTYPSDSTAMLLNETAVRTMHFNNPLGAIVKDDKGVSYHIVGIIKDFVIANPYAPINPMIIQGLSTTYPVVHFRLNPARPLAADLADAEKIFRRYNPQYPFEYYFVDDQYNKKFKTEQQEGTLGMLFAALTIFISCLGLFGLATYMAETRTREIGIRKVLGASVSSIAMLISADFIKLVLVAVIIASPVAWYAMNSWLEGFNYRIQITGGIFLVAGLLAIGIALATVSYQAIKAAIANPVKSLKSE
jgi:ABC-type antimicrobial peptide transport system permease subunit